MLFHMVGQVFPLINSAKLIQLVHPTNLQTKILIIMYDVKSKDTFGQIHFHFFLPLLSARVKWFAHVCMHPNMVTLPTNKPEKRGASPSQTNKCMSLLW